MREYIEFIADDFKAGTSSVVRKYYDEMGPTELAGYVKQGDITAAKYLTNLMDHPYPANPKLSQRAGRARAGIDFSSFGENWAKEELRFVHAVENAETFDDLPNDIKDLIVEGEAEMQRRMWVASRSTASRKRD